MHDSILTLLNIFEQPTMGEHLVCRTQEYVKKCQKVVIDIAAIRVKYCLVIFVFHFHSIQL